MEDLEYDTKAAFLKGPECAGTAGWSAPIPEGWSYPEY